MSGHYLGHTSIAAEGGMSKRHLAMLPKQGGVPGLQGDAGSGEHGLL